MRFHPSEDFSSQAAGMCRQLLQPPGRAVAGRAMLMSGLARRLNLTYRWLWVPFCIVDIDPVLLQPF